jgi:aldehyde dehydrogenase (NAD+)/aldehyde dehydrogenase
LEKSFLEFANASLESCSSFTGCTAVVKPAEQTPTSVIMLMELIGDILPAGVLNIVTGFGAEAGQALATSKRIAKLSSLVLRKQVVVSQRSRKYYSCNYGIRWEISKYFLPSVAAQDDKFFSKAVEGALMFALNQGEICNSITYFSEDIADLSSKECKLV